VGEHDKLFPKDYAARWGAGIPGATVEIIPPAATCPRSRQPDLTGEKCST